MVELSNSKELEHLNNSSSSLTSSKERTLDWADLISKTIERLTGKDLSISYTFDNLEIEVPKTYSMTETSSVGANWKINGKITISTELSDTNKINKK